MTEFTSPVPNNVDIAGIPLPPAGGAAPTIEPGLMPDHFTIIALATSLYDTGANPMIVSPIMPGVLFFVRNNEAVSILVRGPNVADPGVIVLPGTTSLIGSDGSSNNAFVIGLGGTTVNNSGLPFIYLPNQPNVEQHARVQAAVNQLAASNGGQGGILWLGPGSWYTADPNPIVVSTFGIRIMGSGPTTIWYTDPPIDGNEHVAWSFNAGNGRLVNCGISGIRFFGPTATKRVAIDVVDCSQFYASDIHVQTGYGAGTKSVGIRENGRDAQTFERLYIAAPLPILIRQNPNNLTNSLDHVVFRDCYLLCEDVAEQCILVEPGVMLQDISFEGFQAWVNGLNGFKWIDNVAAVISRGVYFRNVRMERQINAGGFQFLINLTGVNKATNVSFTDCYGGDPGFDFGGWFLRGVDRARLTGCRSGGTGAVVAFDINATDTGGVLDLGNFWAGTVNTGTLVQTGVPGSLLYTWL